MKQISGYVLAKESNSGIPNLVVTAYDSEKSIQEIMAGHPEERALILADLGKRIGSVLTDRDGKFTLKSEDLEFQGNESRPDLLIIIFAPEDIQNIEAPYPLPPEQRILYISSVPREDAGAEEAFVIRLLQAQLDHYHILATNSSQRGEADVQRYINDIEATWKFKDALRDKLSPRLQEEQKNADRIRKIAQEKVGNLSAIPRHLRDGNLRNNNLLINGKKELADNLRAKQDQAIKGGLRRFQTRTPVMHLRLTQEDLNDLGLKEKDGKIVGEVDSSVLFAKVRSLTKGVDLVKARGLNNPSPDELERKYLTPPAPAAGESQPSDLPQNYEEE